MRVRVNGDVQAVETGATVSQLLEHLELAGRPCAVEVNAVVVPRREHGDRRLREGDTVEIVTLVGGG
jgi:sulfur carrier protein